MKGIATMTPADFQSEFGSNTASTQPKRPALHVVGQDHTQQNEAGQAAGNASAPRQQAGFLNQSIDEIARLYVESPFSW